MATGPSETRSKGCFVKGLGFRVVLGLRVYVVAGVVVVVVYYSGS